MSYKVHESVQERAQEGGRGVERCSALPRSIFAERYAAAPGSPIIVTDATDDWGARSKWDFDFFRRGFGSQVVVVIDRLVKARRGRRVRLDRYLDYVADPEGAPLVDPPPENPFYLTTWSPIADHPELRDDFDDPYFVDNWYRKEPGALRTWYERGFGWIFLGPAGTLSPFHVDLFGTHAWLAQLQGRKRFVLLSPAACRGIEPPEMPFGPNFEITPEVAALGPLSCVLEPGEVLFIPAGWPHAVISLEPSISLTFNFVNASNFQRHMLETARQLPLWVQKLEANGGRQDLALPWSTPSFPKAPEENTK